MPDRILSAVVYDTVTKSYANLTPANSPLLLNDTGDLIFNTNNLALYNNGSNNKIIRPTGPFSYYFGTNLDNVLIGGNNSTIIGGCQSILNSTDSMISGDYFSTYGDPVSCRFTYYSSITNSTSSKILAAGGWSSIYSSQFSCITGGQLSTITNGYGVCILNASFSTIINSSSSKLLGTYSVTNTTGGRIFSSEAAYNANLYFGGYNCGIEANTSLARFNSVLGGTGWANGLSLFWSTAAGNSDISILGGNQNAIITSQRATITNSFCSTISGVTNFPGIGRSMGGGGITIACWGYNQGNSILGSDCSCIFNQVTNSVILGGCKNEIISSDYPRYFSGSDSATRFDRIVSYSAILAGAENQIRMGASCSTILGGYQNKICSGFLNSVILGGWNNILGSNLSGCFSTINNGQNNTIQGGCFQNISAGSSNLIGCGNRNTILNGSSNSIFQSSGIGNLIGNGESNVIGSNPTNIGSCYNTIINGKLNCNYSNLHSTIINGCNNKITSATSNYVFIGGGSDHCVVGNASYSYILGGYKGYIQNGHSGSAVLGDGQNRVHASFNSNNLTLDFINGVYFAQTGIFGETNFSTRPKVNNIPILISGQTSQIFTSPTSANSAGTSGQFVVDGDYFYFCKKDNTWVRTALSSW
jgi:hypothetical protein